MMLCYNITFLSHCVAPSRLEAQCRWFGHALLRVGIAICPAGRVGSAAAQAQEVLAGNRRAGAACGAAASDSRAAAQPKSDLAPQRTRNSTMARDNLSPRFGASSFDLNRAAIESHAAGHSTRRSTRCCCRRRASRRIQRRERRHPRAQRARQCAIPHQWHHSAGRHFRLRSCARHRASSAAWRSSPARCRRNTACAPSGIVDIQTKSGNSLTQGGSIGIYGGSRETLTPSFDYSGRAGNTEYFFAGRGFTSNLGIENPTPTAQCDPRPHLPGQLFSYTSTLLDDFTRASRRSSATPRTAIRFRTIRASPCADGVTSAFGVSSFDSANLNEKQAEQNNFRRARAAEIGNGFDFQLAAFTRYSTLHFMPDTIGDVLFNGQPPTSTAAASPAASRRRRLSRQRCAYPARRLHRQRRGHAESAIFRPCCRPSGSRRAVHYQRRQFEARLDRRRSTSRTNGGSPISSRSIPACASTRCGNMSTPTSSARASISSTSRSTGTTFHAGYARYFTPPQQALAGPVNACGLRADVRAAGYDASRTGLAGAFALFRCRRRADVDARLAGRRRRLLQDRPRPARRRPFGPGLVLNALQLREGAKCGVEFSTYLHDGQFQGLRQYRLGHASSRPISSRTNICSAPTNSPTSPATTSIPIMRRHGPARPARPICGTAPATAPT